MSRSLAQNLLDNVRLLSNDASTLHFDILRDGTISLHRLENLMRVAVNTRKALKKANLWRTL